MDQSTCLYIWLEHILDHAEQFLPAQERGVQLFWSAMIILINSKTTMILWFQTQILRIAHARSGPQGSITQKGYMLAPSLIPLTFHTVLNFFLKHPITFNQSSGLQGPKQPKITQK